MNENNLRYSGPPTFRQSYMNEFVVECPRCKHEAIVIVDRPFWREGGKLSCGNCMHSEKAIDLVRFRAVVKRHCDNCGREFETVIPNQRQKVHSITIPCPHCEATRTYEPKNEEYQVGYLTIGQAADPIFGLPLWFQADFKGDLFWAYNRSHLNEIKSYVTSKLRERQTTTHTTMVERLPKFIKYSKNRESIIKLIDRLERKAFG